MSVQSEAVAEVHRALTTLPPGRWLIAVSGGRDSMVLLDAMAAARRPEIAAVATFDHGTGRAAQEACALVERTALERGIPVVSGRMRPVADATEALWRAARWRFLEAWSNELRASVVTAHHEDDQIETVVLRLMRFTGARGLAGMYAETEVVRPFLGVRRSVIEDYARDRSVKAVEDPSNRSRAHQRNRLRLDLLPALERASPGFGAWCLDISARAAALRETMEDVLDSLAPTLTPEGAMVLRAAPVADFGPVEWAVLWNALAGRMGIALDWRGIERAATWAPHAAVGSRIPLAGGVELARTARTFVIRRVLSSAGTTSGDDDYILNE